ncbi:MAG: ABC transporter permease subunit [Verrucomicrobia bacterium]|nr:ABC transporter permease subunit [Verrucomicrobiota bacterium]
MARTTKRSPDSRPPRSLGSPETAIGGGSNANLRQNAVGTFYTLAGLALFFAAWWWAASQLPRSRLVTPLEAGQDLWANFLYSPRLGVFGLGDTGYGSLLLYTISNVLIGLVTGGAIGGLMGVASGRLKLLRLFVDPIVLVLGTVPVLVAAPLFLLWFGVVPFTQVLLVAFYSAVMMVLFSQRAAENISPIYERWALTLGAGLNARIRHVLIPGTVPEIIGGLRITLASAWGLEIFAEILGAPSGIGQAIKALTNISNVPGLLACVVLVAVTAIVTDMLLVAVAKRVTAWA